MVDFKKALAKKRAAARMQPVIIENHQWFRLYCVTDKLVIELEQIYDDAKGKMFIFKYPEEGSTKSGTSLTMPESQIEDEIKKGIFEIINVKENDNSKSVINNTETSDIKGKMGVSETVHRGNSLNQQSSLFS